MASVASKIPAFTPGPWQTGTVFPECVFAPSPDGNGLILVTSLTFPPESTESQIVECGANARLIAAAPQLLDIIRHLIDFLKNENELDDLGFPFKELLDMREYRDTLLRVATIVYNKALNGGGVQDEKNQAA